MLYFIKIPQIIIQTDFNIDQDTR